MEILNWIGALAHWFGSAVCHQWPTHSYFIAGVELPLCARCTGMYLGGLASMLYHARVNPRATEMPPPWVLTLFVLFFSAWGGDGLNSFLSEVPNAPHLYQPLNILRLTTGMLMGLAMGTLAFVMFNSLVRTGASRERVLARPREFVGLLGIAAVLILIVNSVWEPLLYPLILLLLLSILVLHMTLVGAFLYSLVGRERSEHPPVARILAPGLGIALVYLSAIAFGRVLLGLWLGVPI